MHRQDLIEEPVTNGISKTEEREDQRADDEMRTEKIANENGEIELHVPLAGRRYVIAILAQPSYLERIGRDQFVFDAISRRMNGVTLSRGKGSERRRSKNRPRKEPM